MITNQCVIIKIYSKIKVLKNLILFLFSDLVRGSLCSSLKHILENGLKPPSILTGPVHPWMFIQVNISFGVSNLWIKSLTTSQLPLWSGNGVP